MKKVFDQVRAELKKQLESRDFERWIKPLELQSSTKNALTVQVPNIFFKTWINDNYDADLKRVLSEITGRNIELLYTIKKGGPASSFSRLNANYGLEPSAFSELNSGLNGKYTFSNFVVGGCNQLAHAASLALANRTASYNPLFIYGGSGLGKTHLLYAIGNMLLSQDSGHRVAFLSSEKFLNEMNEAISNESMSYFRQKYRNIDTLLVDDIHFIGGKERAQEEFLYTFNALYEADKRLAFTSDKIPKQIPGLEKRLRSRLEGGLFADIAPPDQETKINILSEKAKEKKIGLSEEAAAYVASHNESNIRVLEGLLARLKAFSDLKKEPITVKMAQRVLGQFLETEKKQITVDQILRLTAGFFNVKISDLKSGKKQRAVAAPRQVSMYLSRKLTSLSTIEIGQRIGGRDHSTVIHADKKVKGLLKQDRVFARILSELEQAVLSSVNKT
ncbi:MAG: chromosomal replication initiator protein DnaA [Deltaproteobacteria bacterium]|nr:chromosomal replication initiator protein DnaA [Deltaproteobacteria bacterium]